MVFAQYLETEFRDLRLVLSRWTTYIKCIHDRTSLWNSL